MYVLLIVFKVLSSLFSPFESLQVWSLHWMEDGPDGGKEEKKSMIWSLSRRTVERSSLSACSSDSDLKGSFQIFQDLP